MTIRRAVFRSETGPNLPHFRKAASTSFCAISLARGSSMEMPALGSITTATVLACRTYGGSRFLVLSFANPRVTSRLNRSKVDARLIIPAPRTQRENDTPERGAADEQKPRGRLFLPQALA